MPKNKKITQLGMIIVAFVLPVVCAFVMLKMNWFTPASTNKGELLQPIRQHALAVPQSVNGKWLIMYKAKNNCDSECQNSLYALQQVRVALGKNVDRVSSIVLTEQSEMLTQYDVTLLTNITHEKFNFLADQPNALYVADPLGNVMMRYHVGIEKQDAIMAARDMLRDLNKMLKLSKVG
ncbi:hypothetical protein [Algibacillus agarilyticus]|uniref:hypothetical protein n=1 Tax=Algibacillus agarilyticus TaxID=2234133 RepID=UPI000DCFC6E3|nr:hypothetical protein [Algibacillus agarilyticus]